MVNYEDGLRDYHTGARTSIGLSRPELPAEAGIGPSTLWRVEMYGDGTIDVLAKLWAVLYLRYVAYHGTKTSLIR